MRGAKDTRFRAPNRQAKQGPSRIVVLMGLAVALFVSFLVVFMVLQGGDGGMSLKGGGGGGAVQNLVRANVDTAPRGVRGAEGGGKKDDDDAISTTNSAGGDTGAGADLEANPKSLAVPAAEIMSSSSNNMRHDGQNQQQNVASVDVEKKMLEGIEAIRAIKKAGRPVETDSEAQAMVPQVQALIRTYLQAKYGPGPYLVEMDIKLPEYLEAPGPGGGKRATLRIDMAPISVLPYTVYFFLEHIVTPFQKGNFHRNAGHVLQAMLSLQGGVGHTNFAWQEYSPAFPHQQWTMGFAGRPSGSSAVYISTIDNTRNHGPASQGSKTEADACWGKLADEASIAVAKVMNKQKGGAKGSGFISDQNHWINIEAIRLVK